MRGLIQLFGSLNVVPLESKTVGYRRCMELDPENAQNRYEAAQITIDMNPAFAEGHLFLANA